MADEADVAAALIEENERIAVMTKKRVGIRPMGACHNCEEGVAAGHLFCDLFCKEDWQRRDKAQNLRGLIG